MNVRIARIAVASLALLVAACGGGDDAAPATDPPATDPPSTSTAATSDPAAEPSTGLAAGPDATVAPELPDELLAAVGPVEVRGDALPALESDDPGSDAAIGAPAPVLVGLDYDGQPVRVDGAADGPTMVVFLAHWCPHCNDEIPRINQLRDEGRIPESLRVVGVSTAANPGRPNFPPGEWLDGMDWTYPVIADGVDFRLQTFIAADAYGVNAFPFVALVDGDGRVAARWSGGRQPDELMALVTQYLAVG